MGVYTRFKRDPDGFRALVELLESTPASRRQKMIDVGMDEDRAYTEKALEYVLTFEDILNLPEGELAELTAAAPARSISTAVASLGPEVRERFLRATPPKKMGEVRDGFDHPVTKAEIGGAQMKLIQVARSLEKQGHIRTKRIPLRLDLDTKSSK